ncbi:MAG: hypothetical protein K0S46_770 [Moraxellaceae bacterium]|jgi:hypothetical protein|nr:hypothetical protein [Moraxellaceae bacterium]
MAIRAWLVLVALVVSPSLRAMEVTPYTASYHFNLDNKLSGTATRTLERRGNNAWRYTFAASAPIATARETSDFRFDGRTVTPLGYWQERKIFLSQRKSQAQFDWKSRTGTGTRDGKPSVQYKLLPGTLDALNMEIQIRRDLKDLGKLGGPYALATPKEISPLTFVVEGEELLSTPMGKLRTLKVSRKHHDPNRHTTFWLARDYSFLPAKVVQKDESALYVIELTGIKQAK